nr:DNA binding protein [Microvirus sp.]
MDNIYSMFDRAARQFSAPFVEHSDEAAERIVAWSVASSGFARPNRTDFELYCVGVWNPDDGKIGPCERWVNSANTIFTRYDYLFNPDLPDVKEANHETEV